MNPLHVTLSSSVDATYEKNKKSIDTVTHDVQRAITQHEAYAHPLSYAYLPFDNAMHAIIAQCAADIRLQEPALIIAIGIGGSQLGASALYTALQCTIAHAYVPELLFADTFDVLHMERIIKRMHDLLRVGKKVIIVGVTKSGTTAETVANMQVCIDQLKLYDTSWREAVVVITDPGSPLDIYAQQATLMRLPIPLAVGGRYSVFSAAGLFVCALVGIDIDQLCAGARDITQLLFDQPDLHDAIRMALFKYQAYCAGCVVHDYFMFCPALAGVGAWWRQLAGESLGKVDAQGNAVALVPTVSVGTTDLHSIAQRYLGGAHTIATTFVSVDQMPIDYTITARGVTTVVPSLVDQSLQSLMRAALQATMHAYDAVGIPYTHVQLTTLKPYYLGQFLQLSLLEMVYLGSLLGVNPFDQPHVELYKTQMRKILAHE
ncbi:MAG: hypothetical protein WCE21_05955 [Candidatus Babeliales bacterium]